MRRIMTTFPSDDEWEEIERRALTMAWLRVQMERLALFLAGTLILFGLVFFIASHASPQHYDPWAATCEAYLRERNQHGD